MHARTGQRFRGLAHGNEIYMGFKLTNTTYIHIYILILVFEELLSDVQFGITQL